ncbi:response regulator [bacterium (Candidatus Torokbacteria) CG_4_10_14_0_2_um_filter_35_8]|nr:MAG: response regulator [bacterium (Candidatus Torokbacteria) CG_4_10_14_0_2_um_filter_35_8]
MKKVLMVEDDPDQVFMYTEAFKVADSDFEVIVAKDGEEGIKKAKEENPDVVVLDILMNGTSGIDVLEEIKKDPKTKKIPVLVFTNLVQEHIKKKVKELGAEEFIVKTDIVPNDIVKKVEKIVNRH